MYKNQNINSFIEKANLKHNFKYDYSKAIFVNITTRLTIICPEHGEFTQTPKSHLGGHACSKCGDKLRKKNTLEDVINRANKVHNFKYDYSDSIYHLYNSNMNIRCP